MAMMRVGGEAHSKVITKLATYRGLAKILITNLRAERCMTAS